MQKTFVFYQNIGYWFLLFIPLVLIGFYPTYFAVLFRPSSTIVHIHFVLMCLWIGMLIVQPFLYKYKKLSLHRRIGRMSYVLVPLVLISAFLMIRLSYFRSLPAIAGKYTQEASDKQLILGDAAEYQAIAFVYLFLLGIFYLLAILNRRRSPIHARYMLAASLSLLGPTVDRAIYWWLRMPKIADFIPIEAIAFFIADAILLILLWRDYKEKRPTRTLQISLSIYLLSQVSYFLFKKSSVWESFVTLIMQPSI